MKHIFFILLPALLAGATQAELDKARNLQDPVALEKIAQAAAAVSSQNPKDPAALYQTALAYSYLSEVALEVRDKGKAKSSAETGIAAAQAAVALDGKRPEFHRVLGALCGQVIPANILYGLKYGKCAQEEVNKALQLDPKSALNWVASGVGKYYLPASFGGGPDMAIKDFEKALSLDPKLAEAHLWLGHAMRKSNRNADARKALQKALELNPQRVWIKQQLEKTPAQ